MGNMAPGGAPPPHLTGGGAPVPPGGVAAPPSLPAPNLNLTINIPPPIMTEEFLEECLASGKLSAEDLMEIQTLFEENIEIREKLDTAKRQWEKLVEMYRANAATEREKRLVPGAGPPNSTGQGDNQVWW